ncbi:aminotransferase class IV [Fodinibius sp. Rm-B-1B1-1]|uniref:aminotransferase class IV n=1 Tax=Fodinibius alkaliphilus TaxID=3140241 RepID=UPI00315B1117
MSSENNWVIFDGSLVPDDRPVVPVVSRGLMYGDGIFETFRTYQGQVFLLEKHIERLHSGMELLGMNLTSKLEIRAIKKSVYQLLQKNQLQETNAIIRLQVWRGGRRGYHPQENSGLHFSITTSVCPDEFAYPTLKSVDIRRIPSQSLPSKVKLTNGINYILAAKEAHAKGADEALMLTVDDFVSETTIGNIFWVKGRAIFTPDEACDLIPGITREAICNIVGQSDQWDLHKGRFQLDHVFEADAVWMANSVRELLPIKSIDERTFDVNSAAVEKLKQAFKTLRTKNLESLIE